MYIFPYIHSSVNSPFEFHVWAEDMAQYVKQLPCNDGKGTLDPKNPCKCQCTSVVIPIPVLWTQRQAIP